MKYLIAATIAATLTFAAPATAQQVRNNCAPRDVVVTRLAEKYGESRQSIGLGTNLSVVEVFASVETGTWTITVTTPSGMSCLVASGEAYENLYESLPKPEGDPT